MAQLEASIPQILFKDYLNVPSNRDRNNAFFNELEPYSAYTIGDQTLIDPIPRQPVFAETTCPYDLTAGTDFETYEQDSTGVLEKFTKLRVNNQAGPIAVNRVVTLLSDPTQSLNILADGLQFNYGIGEPNPMDYTLFDVDTPVFRTNATVQYVYNFRAGYISMYGTPIPAANVRFTFVRYRGRKGISNLAVSPWVDVGNPVTGISYTAGNVGIGTSEPSASSALDVSGNLTVTGDITSSGDITGFSDVALKKNISTLQGSLEMVMSMRPVSYEMKGSSDGRRRVGFVAQEVERILPQVIHVSPHDVHGNLKSIAYGNLTSPIVGALQEVVRRMDLLDERLRRLEQSVQATSVTAAPKE